MDAEVSEKRKDRASSSSHRDRGDRDSRSHRDSDHRSSSRKEPRSSRGGREDSAGAEDDGRLKRVASDEGDAGLPPRKAPRVERRTEDRQDFEMRSPQVRLLSPR